MTIDSCIRAEIRRNQVHSSVMAQKWFLLFSLVVPLLVAWLFTYPRYTEEDDAMMLEKYRTIKENLLPVMTFNIRFDGVERDPNNHFTKRVSRLTETVEKWQPAIIGLQEAFASQIIHWKSQLPSHYDHIGYQRDGSDRNLEHPSTHLDFQVAILYNTELFELLDRDYFWLSKTPRTPHSKDWDSLSPRALNIARLKLRSDPQSTHLLVFNTHLDVKSEMARQEQAKLVRSTIKQWQTKYPSDLVLLLGDFNSTPNQTAYEVLTATDFLRDSWHDCKLSNLTCVSNTFSSTFHGWFGSMIHTYGAQALQAFLFTFHGSGVRLPYNITFRLSSYLDMIKELWNARDKFSPAEMMTLWSRHRYHVDWILYRHSADYRRSFQPRFVSVVDIRSNNFSSDHFPIVALFQLN